MEQQLRESGGRQTLERLHIDLIRTHGAMSRTFYTYILSLFPCVMNEWFPTLLHSEELVLGRMLGCLDTQMCATDMRSRAWGSDRLMHVSGG
jgi:hypothetical protein